MIMNILDRSFDHPMKIEERAAMPLAGGIMQNGYQCGMIWGAALAAGAQAYRLHGAGPKAETAAIGAASKIVDSFQARQNTIDCLEITDLDKNSTNWQMTKFFLLKGGTIGCSRMASNYAPSAFSEINSALSEEPVDIPCSPASCAAKLAQKMGASEKHTVMAAGLAGGIGLCGGACGALGAAIWLRGINIQKEGDGKLDYKFPEAVELIDRFLKRSDYKFECSEIVGRKFENVGDHADYLAGGGCSEILEELAAQN
jgi:Putative redox-active protein (C_GCAxxG_C_C)